MVLRKKDPPVQKAEVVEEDPTAEYSFPEDVVELPLPEVIPESTDKEHTPEEINTAVNTALEMLGEEAEPTLRECQLAVEKALDVCDETSDTDVRISVGTELRNHYELIKAHRRVVLIDPNSETKDINAVLTATTTIIKELDKIQHSLYNSEKYAIFQQVVISVLKECDEELKEKVVSELENRLARL